MELYLRANKVTDADEKIIAVLDRFQGGTAGAFAQQKLNKINRGDDTPSVRNDSRREIYSRGGAWPQQLVVPTSTLAPSGF